MVCATRALWDKGAGCDLHGGLGTDWHGSRGRHRDRPVWKIRIAEDFRELDSREAEGEEAWLGWCRLNEGDARRSGGVALEGFEDREIAIVVAWSEKDMLALGHRQVQAKGLADLVVGALLATANVYEVEERMGQAKGSTECRELVWVINDATGVQLLA
jgi:hypothetical protein